MKIANFYKITIIKFLEDLAFLNALIGTYVISLVFLIFYIIFFIVL